MTADERIEKLVNRFGQTISDLPKSEDYAYGPVYNEHHQSMAKKEAHIFSLDEWKEYEGLMAVHNDEKIILDYICHLCDVIDRMEAALETATLWADCTACENMSAVFGDHCICDEDFSTADRLLEGRYLNFDEPLIPVSTD
ncbi:MAG: hypothetical protein IJ719_08260 [Clostridia bacterium]|nr:hypothetical protein [Clostridia bacterium]